MKRISRCFSTFIILSVFSTLYAPPPEDTKKIEPTKIGNLALPSSQSPGPLFSFGQILIEKGDVVGYAEYDGLRGCNTAFDGILPFGAYGIKDNLSISIFIPYAVRVKEDCSSSSGIEDILVSMEYAFWEKPTLYAYNWASIVGGVSFPSGSIQLEPSTGTGAYGYFIGFTLVHLGVDWYYYTSHGASIENKKNGNKASDEYLYQFGLGRNIKSPPGWIFMGLVELVGFYIGNEIVDNKRLCNHESNFIFLAPSFFAANERLTIHVGVGFCIFQHVPKDVHKQHYLFGVEFGWKFDGPALKGNSKPDFVR